MAVLLLALLSVAGSIKAQEWKLASPDKKIVVSIVNSNEKITYTVSYNKQTVIAQSPLGIQLDSVSLTGGLMVMDEKRANILEKYTLLSGRHLKGANHGRELALAFGRNGKQKISITFRAYNDGVAFRYYLPGAADGSVHVIEQEASGFAIPQTAKVWVQPYDLNGRKKPSYETYYQNGIAPGSQSPNPAGWAFPVLFTMDNVWALISEAGLDDSYSATHLEDKAGNGIYTIRFPEKEEVIGGADSAPLSTLPWITPWRLIVIGPSLNTLEQTTLITDLNPPSRIEDTSWIKPGRATWSWWSKGSTTRDFNVQKEYIDFNASMGWEYVLIDAGWPQMEGGRMEDLVAYGEKKGVGIFLWYHSGMGREKDSLSIDNVLAFAEPRKKEFERIKQWGVKGVKVDFFDGDKQPVIKRYHDIMKDAANYKLMVNFHGSTLPRGWERTYPNLLSMESVKGAEGYGNPQFCERAPVHNTILPFTRNIAGSMDYTPVTFTNKREAIRQTTFAHELALSIVFESGVFHFADQVNSYKALPEAPKRFLMNIPTAWDETRYVAGQPGQYVVLARRKGANWYIGGINGQPSEQQVELDLSFLGKKAALEIITDGESPVTFSTHTLDTDNRHLKIKIAAKGGFVASVK